jgi:sugar phosphate isomerase/epimerase
LELASQTGIGWLEVPIRTAGYLSRYGDDPLLTDESSLAEVSSVVSQVSDRGLAIAAVPCPTGPLHRPEELARAVKKLQLAARLGAPLITCDVGDAPDEEEQRRLVTHLRQLGAAADGEGVLVALEFSRGFTRNHRYLQYLLREVEHPRIRACFDPGLLHSLNDEIYSEVALAKLCHLVKHCRWRDFDGVSGSREFPPPGLGSGCINFVRMYQILRDAGYRGTWSLAMETAPEGSFEPPQILERITHSLGYLKRIGALDPY